MNNPSIPNIVSAATIGSANGKLQTPYAKNMLNETSISIQSGAALSSKFMSSQMTRGGGTVAGILSMNNLAETKGTVPIGLSALKKEKIIDEREETLNYI